MEREPWHHQPSLSMGTEHMRTAAPLSKDSLGPQGATGCWHFRCLAGAGMTCDLQLLACCGTSCWQHAVLLVLLSCCT